MANYYGTTLCKHPFAVNDPDKFEKRLKKYGLYKEKHILDINIMFPSQQLWYDFLI